MQSSCDVATVSDTSAAPALPPRWLVAAAVIVAVQIVAGVRMFDTENSDFVQYYVGARNLLLDGDPYTQQGLALGLKDDRQNCYPPAVSYLCAPLALLDVQAASLAWLLLSYVLSAVWAWQLCRLVPLQPQASAWLLLLAFILLYYPHFIGIDAGQMHAVVAVLVTGALMYAARGAEHRAGVLLGLATLIKVFPGFLLLALWLAGRRRAAVVGAVVAAALALLTFGEHAEYVRRYVLGAGYPIAAQCFVSIPGLAERLFAEHPYGIPAAVSPLWRNVVVVLAATVVLGSVLLCARRKTDESMLYAVSICAMLLLTPPLGLYHLNLAVLAAALCVRARRAPRAAAAAGSDGSTNRGLPVKTMVAAFLLTAIPIEYGIASAQAPWLRALYTTIHTRWGLLLLVPQFYGLLLLFGVCVHLALRRVARAA